MKTKNLLHMISISLAMTLFNGSCKSFQGDYHPFVAQESKGKLEYYYPVFPPIKMKDGERKEIDKFDSNKQQYKRTPNYNDLTTYTLQRQ